MLTVLTWLWAQPDGRAAYTAREVNVWAAMVRRNLSLPHRLACVTDMPAGIDPDIRIIPPPRDFEHVRVPTWGAGKPQCMRRLALFRPDAASIFGERFVSMDLDCVVTDSIDPLFRRPEDVVLYQSPPGTTPPRPYNGSMLMMTAGARPQVYERFTQAEAEDAGRRFAGSDQAWFSHVLGPGESTWSEADGVVWWGRWKQGVRGRLIFFPGLPKPWDLTDRHSMIRAHYAIHPGG